MLLPAAIALQGIGFGAEMVALQGLTPVRYLMTDRGATRVQPQQQQPPKRTKRRRREEEALLLAIL